MTSSPKASHSPVQRPSPKPKQRSVLESWMSIMNRMMTTKTYENVLSFWFGSKSSRDYLKQKSFWYGSPADDAYVRKNLGTSYEAARSGELDSWTRAGEGEGALALILLLDQVPRNIFRDKPQAYATDSKAVSVARVVVGEGWDKNMPSIQRRYIYSPFNHSEILEDQELSVKLFTELGDPYHLQFATDFYEQIKRDGRFKHRDQILGR